MANPEEELEIFSFIDYPGARHGQALQEHFEREEHKPMNLSTLLIL